MSDKYSTSGILIEQRVMRSKERQELITGIISLLRKKGLSYHQAIEILDETRAHVGCIPIGENGHTNY